MYAINYADNQGYTIISANKEYIPVLAEIDEGYFQLPKDSSNRFIYWLQAVKEKIGLAKNAPDSIKNIYRAMWMEYDAKTIPLYRNSRSVSDVQRMMADSISSWQCQGYQVYRLSDYVNTPEFASMSSMEQEGILQAANVYANQSGLYGSKMDVSFVKRRNPSTSHAYGPYLDTHWPQGGIYGTFAPNGIAGCATIALGQIMYYHRHPVYSCTIPGHAYDWHAIRFPTGADHAENNLFLGDIAYYLHPTYYTNRTSASVSRICNTLYSLGYTEYERHPHNMDEVRMEIYNGRPLLMSGGSGNSAHIWICDGFKWECSAYELSVAVLEDSPASYPPEGFDMALQHLVGPEKNIHRYHMNWGWGNYYDGWFLGNDVNVRPEYDLSTSRYNFVNVYYSGN